MNRQEVTPSVSTTSPALSSSDELAAEATCGIGLARALAKHISRMGASGYSNEFAVGEETWIISVAKRTVA